MADNQIYINNFSSNYYEQSYTKIEVFPNVGK